MYLIQKIVEDIRPTLTPVAAQQGHGLSCKAGCPSIMLHGSNFWLAAGFMQMYTCQQPGVIYGPVYELGRLAQTPLIGWADFITV